MAINNIHNQPLAKPLRTQLENTVKTARDVAEKGARAALSQLAVGEAKAPDYLSEELKALRRRMRAHGRALGDAKSADDTQAIQHLVWEMAYEHWHRMLFARFLAENGLLLWEPGAAVSLDDCDALVQEADPTMNLGAKSKWELAGKLAARMLPQVFKPLSPVFELAFAPEHQRELERLLAALTDEVFQASDSLGWVYQFWQAKRKDEVNASEVKIGADELPAVTQLFTEPYMVDFLLHNSLGAWWVTRHPGKPCPVPLTYLRTLDDGTPAAGKFEGWPDRLNEFTLLDPCCGSGHFLVAAFLLLVPMRMAAEGLTAMDAVDYVLQENLHGLELDARCVEIAVFALALAAWRFPDEDGNPLGVRADMPAPQVACCGLKVAAKPEDWMALVPDDAANAVYLRQELRLLHASFAQAPLLGSLLDPARSLKNDLATSSFDTLRDLLGQALATEVPTTLLCQTSELQDDSWDLALTAKGLLDAARLLDGRYHLVVTNVPYLARGKQHDTLKDYCETHYPEAKNDLANVFLERCLELSYEQGEGVVQIVMPQNWLFLTSYKKQRESLLKSVRWNLLARLGPGAFETIGGEVVQAILLTQTRGQTEESFWLHGVDVSAPKAAHEKAALLQGGELATVNQKGLLGNPDARVALVSLAAETFLSDIGLYGKGSTTGDSPRFLLEFWQLNSLGEANIPWADSPRAGDPWSGRSLVTGVPLDNADLRAQLGCWLRGQEVWGRTGVAVNKMKELEPFIYSGEVFDDNVCPIIPKDSQHLPAVWAFVSDPAYRKSVREVDAALKVTAGTLTKVPFDLIHWQQVAVERYPNGLPKPYSDDPTQWLFHGHPQPAIDTLQVAVARLLGYRWPAETDTAMELADEARNWIARCNHLVEHADDDGIVCLPSVRQEHPAHKRLLDLLIDAWDSVLPGSWKPAVLDKLLSDADCAGKGLDVWLREKFFEQHAKRFHHRPFIWHVWDGLKDGFAALVNYHKLDAKNLERLIHTYLGDWIRQQEEGVRNGVDGAEGRLSAAQNLKQRLELILEGEAPYDIFVRWKPLAEQPIGWNPDLNDGVRLNIRPFMAAEVLRINKPPKLNIKWDKDRGKDVESAPWFHKFQGDRINDHHLTLAEKKAAREARHG
ncbi:Eco57I restriction-modification methylase domain-containing protein [Aquitalea denitrificans]|uniref:Eco57I restriction-modification methylase domain-containing protein n=1 Tax=Aquitalea denitrificans TaxID=519081 RepID=UPI001358A310|nr:DNA methyltransferase [Aquitalea denitrificans]